MKVRQARCGHDVPAHPGHQQRACNNCAHERLVATATTCRICPAPLPPLRSGRGPQRRLYCSKACVQRAAAQRVSEARRAARPPIDCPGCGKPFTRNRKDKKYCSLYCGEVHRGQRLATQPDQRTCALPSCGVIFQPLSRKQRCCSEPHGKRLWHVEHPSQGSPWNDRRRDAYHRRRAQKKATIDARPVLLSAIRERDKNRCHLCRKKVGDRVYPHPMSASLDHVIPLSQGGEHTPENVRLAHLRCNVSKGNRGGNEQLLLIG